MRDEFGFQNIKSTELCVNVSEEEGSATYLIPSDRGVQKALREILESTVTHLEASDAFSLPTYEPSEKYAAREPLIARLTLPEMANVKSIFEEEGWASNPHVLSERASLSYYFAVFRDQTKRKLVGVRRAAQFKGVVKSRFIRLLDDSVAMIEDRLFRLDHEFDFLVTDQNVYVLNPAGFEQVAEIEALATARVQNTLSLGKKIRFVDFESLADFAEHHKKAARLVAALGARSGLDRISGSKFKLAARDTQVELERVGKQIRPANGSEIAFLELLDDRRYTTALKPGAKDAYVASSRRPIRPSTAVRR
jgi:Domain of unknown function (DUF4868)